MHDEVLNGVLDEWATTVLGWCQRLGGPLVNAEDASQDVLLVLLRRGGSVQRPEVVGRWLFGVTRRVLAAHRRRAWVRRWVPGAFAEAVDDAPDPAHQVEVRERNDELHAAVLALPAKYREVIVLCDLEDRTDTQVAAILSISRETVKTRRRRGRLRLRGALANLSGTPDIAVRTETRGLS